MCISNTTATDAATDAASKPQGSRPGARPRGHDPGRAAPDPRPTVALVTGGSRGIGRLVAVALAERAVAVGVLARSRPGLAETVRQIRSRGGTATLAIADTTDAAALAMAVAGMRAQLGPIDLLVNNAGTVGPIGPLWEVDLGAWWDTIDVNVRGALLCTRLVLPDMVARGRGRIVNVASQAGRHRWPPASGHSVSEAAITKLTENLGRETRRHGVSVFSVHPGHLPAGLSDQVLGVPVASPSERTVQPRSAGEPDGGRGAEPGAAVELLVRVALGDADRLSGCHLSVHDDLDALLAQAAETEPGGRYALRPGLYSLWPDRDETGPDRLDRGGARPGAAGAPSGRRPNRAPAYYLGRPAALWQRIMARRDAPILANAEGALDRAA
jgi:NAD(P)-dependent dehydrogenase (short-subunit alcohol dehydrogenase family)